MATTPFLTLPPEIHVSIAKHCGNSDLINLCLTCKRMNETCLRVLYRSVDLQLGSERFYDQLYFRTFQDPMKRQQQFVQTLLSHPEYGKHVRALKGKFGIPSIGEVHSLGEDIISEEELWRAMQLLTHVQSVDVACKVQNAFQVPINFPTDLFQSATSIRLVGEMEYGLAKSILNAINPATLEHLCLDMVREENMLRRGLRSGNRGGGGRTIAFGPITDLLTPLTGRCTALRTLILRRRGHIEDGDLWHTVAEEASYIEWVLFIQSVQGTLENFTFEQTAERCNSMYIDRMHRQVTFRTMHERFRRHVLPAIVSRNWPRLTVMELRGVSQDAKTLLMELEAALGGNAKILVDKARDFVDSREPYRWNYV